MNTGVSYTNTPSFNAATKTPNAGAGPLNLGINAHGDTYSGVGEETIIMTTATTMVYGRALEEAEVGTHLQHDEGEDVGAGNNSAVSCTREIPRSMPGLASARPQAKRSQMAVAVVWPATVFPGQGPVEYLI